MSYVDPNEFEHQNASGGIAVQQNVPGPSKIPEDRSKNIQLLMQRLNARGEEGLDIFQLSALAKKKKVVFKQIGRIINIDSSCENSLTSVNLGSDEYEDPEHEDLERNPENSSFKSTTCGQFCRHLSCIKRKRAPREDLPKMTTYNHPTTQELLKNILFFCTKTYDFFVEQMIPSVQAVAMKLYFTKFQIEADGLNTVSSKIWMATFLLKSELMALREADFETIREQFVELVWEVETMNQHMAKYNREIIDFQEQTLSGWKHIEKLVGVGNVDFETAVIGNHSHKKYPGTGLRIEEKLCLDEPFDLYTSLTDEEDEWKMFSDLPPAFRSEAIIRMMQTSAGTLRQIQESLLPCSLTVRAQRIVLDPGVNSQVLCKRAITIILSSTAILMNEVVLPTEAKTEVKSWIRNVSNEIRNFSTLVDWVFDTTNDIRQMIQLCYEFANQTYSLDLPSYRTIVTEVSTGNRVPITSTNRAASVANLLTGPNWLAANQRLEHYNWLDFFYTEYHKLLQRLPISVGTISFFFQPRDHVVADPSQSQQTSEASSESSSSSIQSVTDGFWSYYKN